MAASTEQSVPSVNSFTLPDTLTAVLATPGASVTGASGWGPTGARAGRHRHAPDTSDQAALTSIILGVAARGAGTLTSSMPFTHLASTWAVSTPSGSVTLRSNAPYVTSRTK